MFGPIGTGASQVNLPAIFIANGLGASLMLGILLGKRRRVQMLSYDGKFFYWMCRICLVLCALETAGFLVDGVWFPGARQLSVFCSTCIVLLALVMACLWIYYVDYKLFADPERFRKVYPLMALPAGVTGLLALANLFFDVFFGVSHTNVYYRTPLFLLLWVVVYGYITYGAVLSCRHRKRWDRYLFLPMVLFLLPVYLGSLVQLFCYGIALIWASVALGLTFLYINLQSEEAYLDPLTGLYNRSYLRHYMAHVVRRAKKGLRVVGILLDINDFKVINDTFGHGEGDMVLRGMGSLLLHAARGSAAVIRYGGDEFVILLENPAPEQVSLIRAAILRDLERFNASKHRHGPISLSMGSAALDYKNIFGFFQEMDQAMYQEKKAYYLRRGQQAPSNSGAG